MKVNRTRCSQKVTIQEHPSTTHDGYRWNELAFLFFVGKTVGEYNSAMVRLATPSQPVSRYEFVRGKLPRHVILPETEQEKRFRLAKKHMNDVMKVGRYKGTTVYDLYLKDRGYFDWAQREGLIADFDPSAMNIIKNAGNEEDDDSGIL